MVNGKNESIWYLLREFFIVTYDKLERFDYIFANLFADLQRIC